VKPQLGLKMTIKTDLSPYHNRNTPADIQQSQQGQTATNWWQKGNGPSEKMSWRLF